MNRALLWLALGSVMVALGVSSRHPLSHDNAWLLLIVGGAVVVLGLRALLLSLGRELRERKRKRASVLAGQVVGAFREAAPDPAERPRP